ncbi:MAG: hypothetical protein JWQ98_1061 [Chlorobi bacterium]|nr:hypothetical protein [Chlorobiota bacterium]
MKARTSRLLSTALIVLGVMGFTPHLAGAATPAPLPQPCPVSRPCTITITITIRFSLAFGGGTETLTANGTGNFNNIASTESPWSETITPASLNFNGVSPTQGAFTTGFDQSKQTRNTVVQSNTAASRFPATGDLYFYPTVTLSSHPGVVYSAIQEQHLQNRNLNSWDPQINESWSLVNDKIDFEDPTQPGVTAFTLTSQTTTIN